MKIISRAIPCIVGITLFALSASAVDDSEKQMLAEAKVNRTHAERIALAQTHGGTITSGELEREKGHLVWSFDIKKENTPGVIEVQLDAKTGKVLAVEKEDAAKEAAEAKDAGKEKKH